jgi:NADH-quinone oxidoreductase subunit N
MLYGISLLAGALGTCHVPTMAAQLASLTPEALADRQVVLMFGGLFVMVGLAFKLSAVPFHFWCPDVFEGASAEVNAFLSVASKAAAMALLVRVAIGFSHVPVSDSSATAAAAPAPAQVARLTTFHDGHNDGEHAASTAGDRNAALAPARRFAAGLISLIAAITCTFGNLTAYAQTNIKRLLAYSTIAHAGYMMMPVAAAVALAGDRPEQAQDALGSLAFYVGVYLFMNLGAFAVVAFLRNAMRSEEIADYAGLIRRCPHVAIFFSIILISLIGLPPLAGFAGKFLAFAALASAKQPLMYTLFVIGGLNTAISLFYYLRVVKLMTIDPEAPDRLPFKLPLISPAGIFLTLVTVPVVVLGIYFDELNHWALAAAKHLLL